MNDNPAPLTIDYPISFPTKPKKEKFTPIIILKDHELHPNPTKTSLSNSSTRLI